MIQCQTLSRVSGYTPAVISRYRVTASAQRWN
jgi:hypothetical protein